MSIYQEIILDHYKNPRNFGSINNPSKKSTAANPSCGDKIEMDILFENDVVVDIKYRAVGCAISMASASLLSNYIKGKTKDELKKLDKDFMIKLLGIDLGPSRLKCALLSLEALQTLL